jgi:beta-galactosidase/beta-glucuronidase
MMKYIIDKTHYRTFEVFEVNKLAPRAYFIPFSEIDGLQKTDFLTERYNSDRVSVLSGDWKFKYFERVSLMPNEIGDAEIGEFDDIKVPSCWQRTGYEPPVYLNVRYPFKTDPPNFPQDCSVGAYFKRFDIGATKKRNHILTFLGVAGGFDLYINGKFVGYSEGSHNSAEFKIDEYINEGENELLAVVYKWCNGTYLEDQDMFRENGIFRDVYITEYKEVFIYDYFVDTEKNSDGTYNLKLEVDLKGELTKGNGNALELGSDFQWALTGWDGFFLRAELLLDRRGVAGAEKGKTEILTGEELVEGKREIAGAENGETERDFTGGVVLKAERVEIKDSKPSLVFKNLEVREWSAEIPELYELFIILERKIDEKTGTGEIVGNLETKEATENETDAKLEIDRTNEKTGTSEAAGNSETKEASETSGTDGKEEITEAGETEGNAETTEKAEKIEIYDVIRNYTGFKTIQIEGNVFLLNGKKVKIKGVNHHDSDPCYGYVMTAEQLKRDVLLMKEFNVNGVRTSHYPKDPIFIALCDFYGLYVVDEADIETHGCFDQKKWSIFNTQPGMNRISDDPKWEKHYVDRVKRLYFKDRNHPSVVMWSLGNEAGGIANQDACYKMLKTVGAKAPVHYEGARHVPKRKYYDVRSTMYPFMSHVNRVVKGTSLPSYRKVPYFFCEYAHAMGFGPGNLKEYVDAFYDSDILMGGCVWEFVDHAVYHDIEKSDGKSVEKSVEKSGNIDGNSIENSENIIENSAEKSTEKSTNSIENGVEKAKTAAEKYAKNAKKYRYTYGGDHGEELHDGNFCVDGLFYPDRTPHTGALSMKFAYRPLRIEDEGEGIYSVENTNRFLSSGYIAIEWKLLKNGVKIEGGIIKEDIFPEEIKEIAIPHRKIDKSGDFHINFLCRDTRDGRIISEEQIELHSVPSIFKNEETTYAAELLDGASVINVKFKGGSVAFDKTAGRMTSLKYKEKEYINQNPESETIGFYPSVYRAPLDNDNMIRTLYKHFGIKADMSLRLKKITAAVLDENGEKVKKNGKNKTEGKKAEIKVRYGLYGKYKLFNVTVVYVVDGRGKITVTARLIVGALLCKIYKRMLPIQRFGLEIELDGKYDNVEYFGRGSGETLPDIKDHAPVGIYSKKVEDLREKYIKPQDSGNRSEVRYLKISDDKGNGLIFKKAGDNFNFAANRFTTKQLDEAKHQEDLIEKDTVNLRIDGFVRGTGSNSCGPLTLKKYTINMNGPLVFSFSIEPIR